jgi:hypothetical protein
MRLETNELPDCGPCLRGALPIAKLPYDEDAFLIIKHRPCPLVPQAATVSALTEAVAGAECHGSPVLGAWA